MLCHMTNPRKSEEIVAEHLQFIVANDIDVKDKHTIILLASYS